MAAQGSSLGLRTMATTTTLPSTAITVLRASEPMVKDRHSAKRSDCTTNLET
jgi:hypothetical protein